jgi:heme A synthase
MKFAKFLSSSPGRLWCAAVGIALVVVGIIGAGTMKVIGLVPLVANMVHAGAFAPLTGRSRKSWAIGAS